MNFSYEVTRNARDGAEVKTVEGLGIEGRAFALELCTSKDSRGGIRASAYVYEVKDGCITMDLFGDYRKTIATSPGRATEKALIALHEKALESFPAALLEAEAHTRKKVAKEVSQRYTPGPIASDFNHPSHPMHY